MTSKAGAHIVARTNFHADRPNQQVIGDISLSLTLRRGVEATHSDLKAGAILLRLFLHSILPRLFAPDQPRAASCLHYKPRGIRMIEARTTLILGAGASCGYDLPLGADLVHLIAEEAARQSEDEDADGATAFAADQLRAALDREDPLSIDAFLWRHQEKREMVNFARKLITQVILAHQRADRFERVQGGKKNWYRFLWDAIVDGLTPEELASNDTDLNINIVTFNYDVSLEFYLYSLVTAPHSMFSRDQAERFLQKLGKSIHHVYGSVLHYQWLGGADGNHIYELKDQEIQQTVRKNWQQIRLIDARSNHDYSSARDAIQTADQVLILGFGFDETNIGPRVLDLRNTLHRDISTPGVVVKYTNSDSAPLIDRRIESLTQNRNVSLMYSYCRIFDALSREFSISSLT